MIFRIFHIILVMRIILLSSPESGSAAAASVSAAARWIRWTIRWTSGRRFFNSAAGFSHPHSLQSGKIAVDKEEYA